MFMLETQANGFLKLSNIVGIPQAHWPPWSWKVKFYIHMLQVFSL